MVLVSRISLTALWNFSVCSSAKAELIEHWRSLQISLNRDQTETLNGAASPVGL